MAGGAKGGVSRRINASLLLSGPTYLCDSTCVFNLCNLVTLRTLYHTSLMNAIKGWEGIHSDAPVCDERFHSLLISPSVPFKIQ